MSRGGRTLSADEKRLWRRVAEKVKARKPLPEAPDEPAEPPPRVKTQPATAPKPTATPRRAAHPAPADRGAEKRVRRGQVEVGASLDLHGHTQASAESALIHFLTAAHARGVRTAVVITGVGRGGEGILKRRFPDWLALRAVRPLVAGFAQAHRQHGGAGAFYVFLKRKTD